MATCKLTYFDFPGGRGEPIRIALHAANMPFEDIRLSFPEFGERRQSLRFNAVPVFELDGQVFTQSNAIGRYVGKLANLYPDDPMQALFCDEVSGALEDLNHYLVQTFGLTGDALQEAREQLMNGRLTIFLKGLDELLVRGGGRYFADDRLTLADLKALMLIRNFRAGKVDHIPADFVDRISPALAEHQARIEQEPVVRAYYAAVA